MTFLFCASFRVATNRNEKSLSSPIIRFGFFFVKLAIINLAKKKTKRIIGLDKDFSLRLVATLNEAQNKNVIYNDNEFWRWKDSAGEICAIPRGIKQITALKNFIVDGKNDAVMGRIEELLR